MIAPAPVQAATIPVAGSESALIAAVKEANATATTSAGGVYRKGGVMTTTSSPITGNEVGTALGSRRAGPPRPPVGSWTSTSPDDE